MNAKIYIYIFFWPKMQKKKIVRRAEKNKIPIYHQSFHPTVDNKSFIFYQKINQQITIPFKISCSEMNAGVRFVLVISQ